jgi:hypothetical protein
MTLNANAVRVAGTGEVYVAPVATAAPTDAGTALPAAWIGLGYTTTDGVSFTMSRDTTDIDAWQGSKLRTVSNAEPTSIEFALMETDPDSFPVVFGGGTVEAGTEAGEFVFTPPDEGTNEIRSCVVEFKDGDVTYRYYFPRVQVEGDVAFSLTRSDAIAYSVTFGVLSSVPRWKMFTDDPEMDPTPALLAEPDPA